MNPYKVPDEETCKRMASRLKPTHLAALDGMSCGMKMKQVAEDLGVSETTVGNRLSDAMLILQANNTTHAVAICMRARVL